MIKLLSPHLIVSTILYLYIYFWFGQLYTTAVVTESIRKTTVTAADLDRVSQCRHIASKHTSGLISGINSDYLREWIWNMEICCYASGHHLWAFSQILKGRLFVFSQPWRSLVLLWKQSTKKKKISLLIILVCFESHSKPYQHVVRCVVAINTWITHRVKEEPRLNTRIKRFHAFGIKQQS